MPSSGSGTSEAEGSSSSHTRPSRSSVGNRMRRVSSHIDFREMLAVRERPKDPAAVVGPAVIRTGECLAHRAFAGQQAGSPGAGRYSGGRARRLRHRARGALAPRQRRTSGSCRLAEARTRAQPAGGGAGTGSCSLPQAPWRRYSGRQSTTIVLSACGMARRSMRSSASAASFRSVSRCITCRSRLWPCAYYPEFPGPGSAAAVRQGRRTPRMGRLTSLQPRCHDVRPPTGGRCCCRQLHVLPRREGCEGNTKQDFPTVPASCLQPRHRTPERRVAAPPWRRRRVHVPSRARGVHRQMLLCRRCSTRRDLPMALNIRNRATEELAATLARMTGETKTQAVTRALQDRLERIRRRRAGRTLAAELDEIALHCASLPVLDDRTAADILGYDESGLPD